MPTVARPASPDSSEWEDVENEGDTGYSHNFNFAELSGPQRCPPRNSDPIAYFYIFCTVNLLSTFASETNKYAHRFLQSRLNNIRKTAD